MLLLLLLLGLVVVMMMMERLLLLLLVVMLLMLMLIGDAVCCESIEFMFHVALAPFLLPFLALYRMLLQSRLYYEQCRMCLTCCIML